MGNNILEVRINDADFMRRYKRLMERFPGAVDASVKEATLYGVQQIKRTAPAKTGNLRRLFGFKKIALGIWEIFNPAQYALSVDQGYRAHRVAPRFKKALYWTATGKRRAYKLEEARGKKAAGELSRKIKSGFDFFSKGHWIPAFAGRHFSERVIPMIAKRLERALMVNLGKIAREAGAR